MNVKILHILSNWKWTECSEPSVDLAVAQKKMGAKIAFACGSRPGNLRSDVEFYARKKGLNNVFAINLPKHFNILSFFQDIAALKKLIKYFSPDFIHCHMLNAHLMAGAARGMHSQPYIIRSCYNPVKINNNIKSRFLYKYCTDGLVVLDDALKKKAIKAYKFNPETVQIAEPGIDLQRFAGDENISYKRADFGLKENNFVAGIVSRIRETRRIDIPLGALHILSDTFPHLRLFLVGHGRKGALDEVVNKPAVSMGITDKVILPGYCRGDQLVNAYKAMDILIYPFPGTDKTCRTVREAMASGVPVIAPDTGYLPKMINDNINGRLIEMSSENLATIISDLIKNNKKLKQISQNAFITAQQKFSPKIQAENIFSLYNKIQ